MLIMLSEYGKVRIIDAYRFLKDTLELFRPKQPLFSWKTTGRQSSWCMVIYGRSLC